MALIIFVFQAAGVSNIYIKIIKWTLRFQPGFAF